jgi:hypothetical protein
LIDKFVFEHEPHHSARKADRQFAPSLITLKSVEFDVFLDGRQFRSVVCLLLVFMDFRSLVLRKVLRVGALSDKSITILTIEEPDWTGADALSSRPAI